MRYDIGELIQAGEIQPGFLSVADNSMFRPLPATYDCSDPTVSQ